MYVISSINYSAGTNSVIVPCSARCPPFRLSTPWWKKNKATWFISTKPSTKFLSSNTLSAGRFKLQRVYGNEWKVCVTALQTVEVYNNGGMPSCSLDGRVIQKWENGIRPCSLDNRGTDTYWFVSPCWSELFKVYTDTNIREDIS